MNNFKVGQRAWHCVCGWGHISKIDYDAPYSAITFIPDKRGLEAFASVDGRAAYFSKSMPVLFHDEVKLEDWPNPPAPVALTDLKVDQLVMVRYRADTAWIPRYFARISNGGYCCTFGQGCTSVTAIDVLQWNEWRLPTEAEQKPKTGL